MTTNRYYADEAQRLRLRVDAVVAERDRLRAALRELELHHMKMYRDTGRDEARSFTLCRIREELAKAPT
jgi:hypothetical protein